MARHLRWIQQYGLVYRQFCLTGNVSIFEQSIHHSNIMAVLGYPSINLFLYSPFVLTLHPRYLKFSTCLISMSCNVILTCDGGRLMIITSVFMRLSLSWYFVKPVFHRGHTLFKFFLRGCSLCNVIRILC